MKSKVIYREAVHSDLQGVLQILPDGYGGIDYVEDQWEEFIGNIHFHPFVAVLEEEIVSNCVRFHSKRKIDH